MRKPFKLKSGNKPSIAQLSGVSPIKTPVREGGKYVDHEHEDGSKHTYASDKTRRDWTIAPGGVDTKGTVTPSENKKEMAEAGTKQAPTRHIKGTTQSHMMQHKFDGDHQDFKRPGAKPAAKMKKAPTRFGPGKRAKKVTKKDKKGLKKSFEKEQRPAEKPAERSVEKPTVEKKDYVKADGTKAGAKTKRKMVSKVKKKKHALGKTSFMRFKPGVSKTDVEKMSGQERQAYGRKIMRGSGTTEEKYNKLQNLGIELKGHEGYEK